MDVFDDDWYAPLGQAQDPAKREKHNFEAWIPNGLRASILLTGAFIAGLGAVSPQLLATSGIASLQLPRPANAALLPPPAIPFSSAIGREANTVAQQNPNAVPLTTTSQVTEADRTEKSSGVRIVRPGGTGAPGALIIDVAKALGKEAPLLKPPHDRPAPE
ncbi:MAG TPA: hypothetical protein VME69_10580 [Methylocella sp.]|nr:hypothetical protein [Methylocella sp.]